MIKYLYFTNTTSKENQLKIDCIVSKLLNICKMHKGDIRPSTEVKYIKIIENLIFNSIRVVNNKNKQLMFTLANNFFSKKHVAIFSFNI